MGKLEELSTVAHSIEEAQQTGALRLELPGLSLTELPESIGQLVQLQELNVSNNELNTLPESIEQLSQLKRLYAGLNRLSTLPEAIGRLSELQILDVPHNQLARLPESIANLLHLERLYLASNQLATLPESIGLLSGLQILDLTGNKLFRLPESLSELRSLRQLYLHQNEELRLPPEVLGPERHRARRQDAPGIVRPTQTLEYYFRTMAGRRPLNEAKLILIGRGAAGKTSIVNRLVYNRFDRDERKTEGIQITDWPIRFDSDEDVRLNIWDFGGQEIMHATHQFFLTQRSLYLLVLNGRGGTEDADAEYWLRIIESFGADSPVIVVLNKISEQPFDVNRRGLQQKFTAIRDFSKTDCEDGTGIEELRQAVKRETSRLKHLRDAFPASWFSIKNRLAGMKENYLTFDEYRNVCIDFGEKDADSQEKLAFYLHGLGIVLNFKDDPRLQDTHVLNPHWVTAGIYTVLNSHKLAAQNGEIHLRDVSVILPPKEYPAAMHRFLFDLMKKFDLCFNFPDDDAHYLVPELLNKEEPEASAEFKPEHCLNFQYWYPVLPEGLLPRFIVRTHGLSEGLQRWRTGVIVQFENNQALVKADAQDKKIFISVSGAPDSRRRLLAIVRSEFVRIHRDIQNFQPKEMVPSPHFPNIVVPYKKLCTLEGKGVRSFPEVVGDDVIEIIVKELLNGVDLDRTPEGGQEMDELREPARLFYSYSHRDETLRDELETHLKLLHRKGLISQWHDRKIEAGEDWKQRIEETLEHADIILLLVSSDFMASEYCYEIEMQRALERHEKKEARVIPIVVRDVNWKIAPFANLQALPKDGLAVTKWPDRDTAWRNVSDGIEKVIAQMSKK